MNAGVLLSYVALAVNLVGGDIEFSTISSDGVLHVIGRQLSDIILSKIKGDERNGDPTRIPPPAKEAVHFEDQHVVLCGPILCISANLTKGTVTGLTRYDIIKFDFKSDGRRVTIDIDIFFPKLLLDAENYEMKGNIMHALPLAGEGSLYFETTGVRIWTTIVLQVTDHTSIESFENSGFSISSIFSRTEFDGNIDGIFNAMVRELLAELLNRFNKAIVAHYGAVLKEIINPILN